MTDLRDPLDNRLYAAARQWQAEQSPPPGIPLDRLDEPLGQPRRWRAMAAAAAAVIVIGATATAVTRSHETARTLPTTVSPTVSATSTPQTCTASGCAQPTKPAVPWRDLPAGHPDVRHREHGQVVTPFDRVSATGTISGDAHPGDVLTFTAVLESSTTLRLDPCPDFNIAFGKSSWHTWQLNCAQVPYHDGRGRPVLPAFKNVRFEMKVTVPDVRGDQKVLWTLDGPQQMPGFYGIVKVTAG